jgi:3D (Asp-Asp-Asp) domain-containing protein
VVAQCDADPLTTAGMYTINPTNASEHKWVAMSRDMLNRWGGEFNYGDKILIEGTGEKGGIYTVTDTMNKRYTNRIDILETEGTTPYKYESVRCYKVLS